MTKLELYKRVEVALLRLNPKMLAINYEVAPDQRYLHSHSPNYGYFCTFGALKASERTAGRIPHDYYCMVGVLELNPYISVSKSVIKTRITSNSLAKKLRPLKYCIVEFSTVNDNFRPGDMTNVACKARYKYMLGWVRGKIKALDKS